MSKGDNKLNQVSEVSESMIEKKIRIDQIESITTSTSSKQTSLEGTLSYQYSLHNVTVKEYIDPYGAYQIQDRINNVVKQWKDVKPQSPSMFLHKLLVKRGYDASPVPAMQSEFKRYIVLCIFFHYIISLSHSLHVLYDI